MGGGPGVRTERGPDLPFSVRDNSYADEEGETHIRAEGSAHERAPGIDCQRRGCGDKSLAGMMNKSGQRRDGFRGFLVSLCAAGFFFDSAHHKNKQNNFMPVVHVLFRCRISIAFP